MEIPSPVCHVYAVYDAFECWRRATNDDFERGRTFQWFKQAIGEILYEYFYPHDSNLWQREHLYGLLHHINY